MKRLTKWHLGDVFQATQQHWIPSMVDCNVPSINPFLVQNTDLIQSTRLLYWFLTIRPASILVVERQWRPCNPVWDKNSWNRKQCNLVWWWNGDRQTVKGHVFTYCSSVLLTRRTKAREMYPNLSLLPTCRPLISPWVMQAWHCSRNSWLP